ncbi:MAG: DnaJ domain-containing protein [Oscillospiraceae bacterium]|nr:DnaJ domain-containing protein [Oscillospiraceae bacterium]
MQSLYDLLEIPKDASKMDIKRGYFKMIKIYSPEKDPENFKRIRNAYERLYDDESRAKYDKTMVAPSDFLHEFMLAKEYIHNLNYKEALDLLLDIRKKYKNKVEIELALGEVYLLMGNTVKAIKVLEPMCKKYNDNQELACLLAKCYDARGFNIKARDEYKRAVALDPGNANAWSKYIYFCRSDGYEDVIELIDKAESYKEDIFLKEPQLYYIAAVRLSNRHQYKKSDYYLKKYLKGYKLQGKVDHDQYSDTLEFFSKVSKGIEFYDTIDEFIKILDNYEYKDQDDIDIINKIKIDLKNREFFDDDEIDNSLKAITEITIEGCDCDNCMLDKFTAEFSIVMDAEKRRKEILYMKKNYQELYNLNAGFFNLILNTKKTSLLEDKYYKKFKTLNKKYHGYFENHGYDDEDDYDEDDEASFSAFDEMGNVPYVKAGPKIGRNEPCPCGSGKKYKNCCGKGL